MAWIRTVPLENADESLLKAMADQRALYPPDMRSPCRSSTKGCRGSSPRTR